MKNRKHTKFLIVGSCIFAMAASIVLPFRPLAMKQITPDQLGPGEVITSYDPTWDQPGPYAYTDEEVAAYFAAKDAAAAGQSSSGTATATPSASSTSKESAKTNKPTVIDIEGQYVAIEETKVYANVEQSEEAGTLSIGQVVEVNGESSNGLYRFPYNDAEGFANKNAFAAHADYLAAWEETEHVDATCTEPGKIVRTNSLSSEVDTQELPALGHDFQETSRTEPTCTEVGTIIRTCSRCGETEEEEIPALGHDEGEWVVAVAPKAFKEGLNELRCTRCGEVLDSEVTPQTFPLPLWSVILIGCGAAGAVVAIVMVIVKKKK